MHQTANASIQMSPIVGLAASLEPIRQLPSKQAAAIAKIERPLPAHLAFILAAVLRQHGHIGNVLTHISGTNWPKVEQALRTIVDPDVGGEALSPLAQNIVELICGDRGVTGRITKPYFRTVLSKILETDGAARLIQHISGLFLELECARRQPPDTVRTANQLQAATGSN